MDHKLNITGIVMPRIDTGYTVVVHLATREPQEIIEHLRRLGYRVGSPSLAHEPEHANATPAPVRHWAAEGF